MSSNSALPVLNISIEVSNFLQFKENVESASALTIKSYQKDLQQVFAENEFISEFELLATVRLAQGRWAHLSAASRNRKAASLKSFFNYLFQEHRISRPLADQISCPKVPKRIPHYLSPDECLSVLKIAAGAEKLLFLVLYGGGLRISEACHLRWGDVDLQKKILRIKGKGNKERLVAVPQIVIDELNKSKSKTEFIWGDLAFPQRKAFESIRQLGQRAGLLRPLHPHVLRHSFATHLLVSGSNLRSLQELLGHSSLQATEKYTHLDLDQLARTLSKHHPLGDKR